MIIDYYEIVKKLGKEKVRENVSLAEYTTFRIGGPADLFIEVENKEELVWVIKKIENMGIPYFILGNGSNVLFSDQGYKGAVIKMKLQKCIKLLIYTYCQVIGKDCH